MRRGFASMLMGISLLVASTGWAGLVFAAGVLDRDQSDQLSTRLIDHEGVHGVLISRLVDGMERHVPVDEPMSRQELRVVAAEALDDPLASAALRDALSEVHRRGLADVESETTFSRFDVNEAARLALIDARPSLRGRILANPLVRVELPIAGLTWFSGMKTLVDRFAVLALAMAVIGFATSFVVADEPTPVLRRGAWWILASAGAWLAIAPLFAMITRLTVPSSYIVFAAIVETTLAAMRNPAMVMASFGVGLLSVSYLIPAVGRRRGALVLERAKDRLGSHRGSSPWRAPLGVLPASTARSALGPVSGPEEPAVTTDAVDESRFSASFGDADDRHRPMPIDTTGGHQPKGSGVGRRLSAAWKEGHGYLDDARVAPFFSRSPGEP